MKFDSFFLLQCSSSTRPLQSTQLDGDVHNRHLENFGVKETRKFPPSSCMHELERRRRVPRRQWSHMKSSEIVDSLKDQCLPACAQAFMGWSSPSSQAARHCSQEMPSATKYASCNLRLPSWAQVAVRGGRISGPLVAPELPRSWSSILMELARPVSMTERYTQMHLGLAPGHRSSWSWHGLCR